MFDYDRTTFIHIKHYESIHSANSPLKAKYSLTFRAVLVWLLNFLFRMFIHYKFINKWGTACSKFLAALSITHVSAASIFVKTEVPLT